VNFILYLNESKHHLSLSISFAVGFNALLRHFCELYLLFHFVIFRVLLVLW
jgi:hypothetical protein